MPWWWWHFCNSVCVFCLSVFSFNWLASLHDFFFLILCQAVHGSLSLGSLTRTLLISFGIVVFACIFVILILLHWRLWIEGAGTSSVLYRLFLAGEDLLLPGNQIDRLASRMTAEQGQGQGQCQAVRLLPVSQSHPWWAGLLPVPVYLMPSP